MNSHIDYIYVTNHPNTFLRRKLLRSNPQTLDAGSGISKADGGEEYG